MQQPLSMKRFDVFYLSSIAVNAVSFFVGYRAQVEAIRQQYVAAGVDMDPGSVLIGSFLFGLALGLLLWWLVSSKGSKLARWILLLVFALGVLSLVYAIASGAFAGLSITNMLTVLSSALTATAIYYLLQPDANAWLDQKRAKA